MDEIRKIPPVTLFLLSSTLLISLGPLLSLLNPYHLLLWYPAITQRYQFWRLITPFFFCGGGGGGLQMLFDLFLLGKNSLDLETNASPPAGFARRTSLYAWSLLIIGTLILATNYPLGSTVLFGPLLSALNYLWSRANPHSTVSFFGMITLPASWLPYAYLGFDVLRGGLPLAVQSATGLLAAHAWLTLASAAQADGPGGWARRIATPPGWLRALLPDSVAPEDMAAQAARDAPGGRGGRVSTRGWGGTAFAPRGREWGDGQGQWAGAGSGSGGGGQTIGGQGGGAQGGSSWYSRIFGGGGGSGRTGGAAAGGSASAANRRDALLEATERRLRAQREASIAGKNARASPAAAVATAASAAEPVSQGQAGRSAGAGASGVPAAPSPSSATLRSRATGGTGRIRNNNQQSDDEEELDASGSGGAVAEQRRPETRSEQQAGKTKESGASSGGAAAGGHQWGSGQRLGE